MKNLEQKDREQRNLEQLRAAAALKTAPNTSKAAVSKLPAMILANGLLATAAFAGEKKKDGKTPKRPEMKAALDGATEHLANSDLNFTVLLGAKASEDLIAKLSAADSHHLQRASAEALAFLGYVKRFTTREGSEEEGED
jgi:CRISPR type III-B/RAMP module-associated protein Cmr5